MFHKIRIRVMERLDVRFQGVLTTQVVEIEQNREVFMQEPESHRLTCLSKSFQWYSVLFF